MLQIQQSQSRDLMLMQTQWASQINPLLSNPLNAVLILKNVSLKTGSNVINHLLAKNQQGWFLTDIQGAATIYRSGPFNAVTLMLNSSADVICNIGVF